MNARTFFALFLVLFLPGAVSTQLPIEPRVIPMMTRLTPILYVDEIEAAVPFWTERLGFEITGQVQDGERLGFLMLAKDGIEIMYQTRSSGEAENPDVVRTIPTRGSILFIETDDLAGVERALEGLELAFPRTKKPYGAEELGIREPAGNLVIFAEFGS